MMLARQAEREGRPQLPLVSSEHPRPASCARTIAAFDAAVDRAFDRIRSPAVDRVVYRLSSAADHSLLWHACGAAARSHTAATSAARPASRSRWASSPR